MGEGVSERLCCLVGDDEGRLIGRVGGDDEGGKITACPE